MVTAIAVKPTSSTIFPTSSSITMWPHCELPEITGISKIKIAITTSSAYCSVAKAPVTTVSFLLF